MASTQTQKRCHFDLSEGKDSLENEATAKCLSGPVDLLGGSHRWQINEHIYMKM